MESQSNVGAQTFAAYLAKQYMAKKGFSPGTVPEASGLVSGSDIVLTRADGMSFQITCMIDREAHANKRFELSRDAVEEIGKQCLKYSGTINRAKMPVVIQIMEIGRTPISAVDRDRLKLLKRRSIFSKVVISAWIIDTSTASVWSNAPFNGRMAGRSFIERLLRAPRVNAAELRRPATAAVPHHGFPFLTSGLLTMLVAVFVGEQIYGIGPSTGLLAPSIRTLLAWGGLNPALVLESGEWYRILSATLLHADALHLLMNGIALFFAGYVLEGLVGRAWFFALFVIGALGGSLMSLAINPATTVSVGASGAIMGLFASAFVCSFRLPMDANRTHVQMGLLRVLIPSLIPLAATGTGQHIDFGAHLGGALSGSVMGLAMLKTWRETDPLPRFVKLAAALSLAGLVAFALAFFPVTRNYHSYVLSALLIPGNELPKSDAELKARSTDLVARFPRDPRARLFRAAALLDVHDAVGAERELRAGLIEEEILKTQFSPELELRLRTMLALVLVDEGRSAEARTIAQPICAASASGPLREALDRGRLCD
jgi:rhomboid protease GluP